ncbi:DUF4349 domain-containing protein [Marivirga sp. S37H4]|uniref:DUF4349 domain-containing protein n=1 Tax=Marivirga aurantiaca TaxID=2802615 RepID=A0A934WZ87_9BACT|nr:DUF4349 domain-containing protein [Marivirga aurantiaca]MBK6265516.1 DUF4349 domain-containing protein [Marivirga aurantiaca]
MKSSFLILALVFFTACHDARDLSDSALMDLKNSSGDFDAYLEIPATEQSPVSAPDETPVPDSRTKKIIKNGGIDFQTENIEKDYQKIRNLLPKFNAYIENENQSKSAFNIQYNLTIRVPSTVYDTLFSSISALAFQLDNRYSNVEDVTERYYDLKARIKNKEALEQRYVELLKKASAIKDILEIEKNLNEVRTEIERLQGQFNYLNKQVNFSTIHLSFYEVLPYEVNSSQREGFGARILRALGSGWNGFLSFLIGLTTLWPFVILTVGVIYLFRKLRRKWKTKK